MNNPLFLNKYQPMYFSDFETDCEMIEILNTLININNLNILFIGDIGSGKTAFLNAVIREYYKNNLDPTSSYEDNILHINSLKEQGINYYRNDVKTFCQTCSSVKGKKKFIVLDDIDLINEQSQQVFRNCIDKYSHNVHFISSCCNSQKVIESLQSRLIIIKIKPITLELANNICTNISFHIFNEYTIFIKNKQLNQAVYVLYNLYDKGYSVMDILDNYFLFVKITDLLTEQQKYNVIPIICKYITIFHNIHEDEIELALFSNNMCSNIDVVTSNM